MKVNHYHMNEDGLNRFFGPLEARVMEIMWSSEEMSIKDVHRILDDENAIAINTVMTVLNRLCEKGHLVKQIFGRGRTKLTLYQAAQTREQFLQEQTKTLTQGLIKDFGDIVVSHMVETLEDADPSLIKQLEEKLQEIRKRN